MLELITQSTFRAGVQRASQISTSLYTEGVVSAGVPLIRRLSLQKSEDEKPVISEVVWHRSETYHSRWLPGTGNSVVWTNNEPSESSDECF